MSTTTTTYLNDIWSIFFHSSDDEDWTLSSYVRLSDVSTVEDFWTSIDHLKDKIPDNMLFMMREGIDPCWDDPQNMYGGCISMKIPKADTIRTWEHISMRVIGETMLNERQGWESINGISISPKKYFSILKVWLKDSTYDKPNDFAIPAWYNGEVLWRSHMDCIRANTEKNLTTL